ncbi:MAG: hypothetical protein ACJ8M4_08440 [Chthoniobacterales bacterium]
MKKLILTVTLAIAALAMIAPASKADNERQRDNERDQRREDQRRTDAWTDFRQLRAEVYQLDLLFSRVDSRLGYGYGPGYHGGGQLRWEYSRLVRDRERLNYELNRRPLDRLRIHALIDGMRDRLRELEVQARVRSYSRYR